MELNRRLARVWWVQGERPEVLLDGGRQRLNLVGAIDVTHAVGFFAEIEKLDAAGFQRFLEGLLKRVEVPGKVYLVLDNARAHHAKALEPFLEAHAGDLELVFLPPYSPDFNPIEVLWRWLKRDVNANVYFESLEELRGVLREYLQQFKQPHERIASLWKSEKWLAKAGAGM